ncbi:MAG TPA: pilin, partial [Pseudomonadales bacterium]|nr:pilin [Pseudomonadales bacterium]
TSAGLPKAASITGNAISSVQVGANGLITVKTVSSTSGLPSAAAGKTFEIKPTSSAGGITWKCKTGTSSGIDTKYLPSECRG